MTAFDRRELIESLARIYVDSFERGLFWDQAVAAADSGDHPDDEDYKRLRELVAEDRAIAAKQLPVIVAGALKPIREQHGVPHWCMDDEGRSDCYHPDGMGMPWPCPTARLCDEIESSAKGGE